MIGDIILYRPQYRAMNTLEKTISWAIQKSTDGPFVHAEVIMDGEGLTIGATVHGIQYGKIPADTTSYAIGSVTPVNVEAQQHAMRVIRGMVGQPYGWLDIFDVMLENAAKNNPLKIALLAGNHFDCSDLCTYYLSLCGLDLPWEYPFIVSPNDLGRFFKC